MSTVTALLLYWNPAYFIPKYDEVYMMTGTLPVGIGEAMYRVIGTFITIHSWDVGNVLAPQQLALGVTGGMGREGREMHSSRL